MEKPYLCRRFHQKCLSDMKRTKFFCILFLTAAVFAYWSCGKKQQQPQKDKRFVTKQEKLNENAPEYLPEFVSISGLRINDTTNNIKVNILCPVPKSKETKINLKPIGEFANVLFKDFVKRAKEAGKTSGEFHKLNIKTVFVNSNNNLISCLLESKEHFAGKAEEKSSYGVTYKANGSKPLSFKEVFPLDERSFGEFKSLFGEKAAGLSLDDLENCRFAVGRDSVYLFINKGSEVGQSKYAAALSVAEVFMINGR